MKKLSGIIYTEGGYFQPGDVFIQNGIITEVHLYDEPLSCHAFSEDRNSSVTLNEAIPSENKFLSEPLILPGLVDIHSHGAVGCDACTADDNDLEQILDYERRNGITSYFPTTMTLPEEQLIQICKRIRRVAQDRREIKGIYLEGPFISKEKRGAQCEDYIVPPNIQMFRRLQESADGMIRFVGMAPETAGGLDFISDLAEVKIVCSIAHSAADYNQAMKAFGCGCRQVTHLYNAMKSFNHREPGVVGAVFDRSDVRAELICDGIHVHPAVVRNTFRGLSPDRVILISDSMEATGMPDGLYTLGGQEVLVRDKKAILNESSSDGRTPTIAGSAYNLMDCVRAGVNMGIPMESVIRSATMTPAKSAGIFDSVGSISVGKKADLLVTNGQLEIFEVF